MLFIYDSFNQLFHLFDSPYDLIWRECNLFFGLSCKRDLDLTEQTRRIIKLNKKKKITRVNSERSNSQWNRIYICSMVTSEIHKQAKDVSQS